MWEMKESPMFRFVAALTVAASLSASAMAADAFTLAPLPYTSAALTPVIDKETMEIHHGKHHQAYVTALNAEVAKTPALAGLTLEQMMARMSTLSPAVRNNGGGHWNHSFFWETMVTPPRSGAPSRALLQAINKKYGNLETMKAEFKKSATTRFGSGWAWLIVTPDGDLAITSTPNQDNPLMDVVPVAERGTPILGNDVWEHAYYLKYQNRRGNYVDAWWQVVYWDKVSQRYADATSKRKTKK
jgi:superoxide dismutase, Fe-Mn family